MPDATLEETVAAIVSLANGDKLPARSAVVAKLALPPNPRSLDIGLYGQAVSDAKKVLAAAKVPQVAKSLDSPLTELFIAGSLDKPMFRYDKKLMELIKGSQGYTPPQEQTIQKLATVFAQCEHQGVLASSHARAITVRQFLLSGQQGQIATINALWNECTEAGVYADPQAGMDDWDTAEVSYSGKGQLPSSIHPIRDSSGEAKTFKRGRGGMPFRQLCVGFRVEGSGATVDKVQWHIDRVNKSGMVPQVTLPALMLELGKNVEGTSVGGAALAPRLNIAQKDLWNESGVCVARSFFGATAFPERKTVGFAVLWAIDVSGLVGYDTENWQLAHRDAGNGPWRSGEKCFARIARERVIGHVVIEKLGDANGWNFRVPHDARWSAKVSQAKDAQRKYVEEELTAWRGTTARVSTYFDFQQ